MTRLALITPFSKNTSPQRSRLALPARISLPSELPAVVGTLFLFGYVLMKLA